jgi:D-alanyl-D-alanine dipeptidase
MPRSLENLRVLPPIPPVRQSVHAGNYKIVPVDFEHPLYDEELVDIREFGITGKSYYFRSDGENIPYGRRLEGALSEILVRRSVAAKLVDVNQKLQCLGVELFVWDAYRPLQTQIGLWKFFEETKKNENPSFAEDEIYAEVIKYVSDPTSFSREDPTTWPTHMTGASVDLTICHVDDKQLLDMGAHFDQMDVAAHTNYYEQQRQDGEIGPEDSRLLNRRLLYNAMSSCGFTNYPFEYWHYDWGNQMYQIIRSVQNNAPIEQAWYGVVS